MSEASPMTEAIERELGELGEPSLDAAELALATRSEDGPAPSLDAEPEVASVARLSELAEPLEFEDLSELELARGWREIERRQDGAQAGAANGEAPHETGGGGPRRWPYLAAGLAVAAAVVLLVLPDGEVEGPSADEVAALGDAARASLRVLEDGQTDTQRAAELAADYRRRLEEQGG